MANLPTLSITLCYSPAARQLHRITLALPSGSTVAQALAALAQLPQWHDWGLSETPAADMALGIWQKRCEPSQPLQDGDQLEIYRPLRVDPMTARRERFQQQGARSAGLFAQRRPGAKPGY